MRIHSKLMEVLLRRGFWQEGDFLRTGLSAREGDTTRIYEMGWEDLKILATIPVEDIPLLLAQDASFWRLEGYPNTENNIHWNNAMGKEFLTARLEVGI